MASVQCFQTLALKPEAALQDGVSAIALNHATATGLYLPVITTVLFGDLIVALVEADQVAVFNFLSTDVVFGC
jgi:hypothetical protein